MTRLPAAENVCFDETAYFGDLATVIQCVRKVVDVIAPREARWIPLHRNCEA